MKIKLLIFALLFFMTNVVHSQYKVAENYLVQKIEMTMHPCYGPFFGVYRIASLGDFYVVNEKDVIEFLIYDSVDKNKLTMLLEYRGIYFKIDKQIKNNILNNNWSNYFNRIHDILMLDNTETYKIGCSLYAIKKIKYAYLDNVEMYGKEIDLLFYGEDDIQPPDDMDTTSVKSARDFYNIDYFQCFLFCMELLPSHKDIQKYMWKKRYEFIYLHEHLSD